LKGIVQTPTIQAGVLRLSVTVCLGDLGDDET
jgi:hypothetical protein